MSLAAAVLVAMAICLRWPDGRAWVRSRLVGAPPSVPPVWVALMGLVAVAVARPWVPRPSGPGVVLVLTGVAVAGFAGLQVRGARARSEVARRRAEVAELVGLMAAELRAGVLPQRVVTGLAADFPVLEPAARAADLGGDVAGALREASRAPGREVLRDVAGAWWVSDRSGAPLASVVERLEQSARADREIAREVEAGAAPARATARLMAALPAVGLLLGSGMGGDPLAVLTGTWVGAGCLALGCGLACAGVAWIERIAASAGETR
jgi:tight adherence protein B